MRMQTAQVPLNMQATEMVETLAQGAMQASREPRAEYKDITMQEKQEGLIFMSQPAWNEFVNRTVMQAAALLWVLDRFHDQHNQMDADHNCDHDIVNCNNFDNHMDNNHNRNTNRKGSHATCSASTNAPTRTMGAMRTRSVP